MSERRCRVCKCTQFNACPGGCWWVTGDLCSSCKPQSSETKARRRYRAWLRLSEVSPDLTLREYLTSPAYAVHRSEA